MRVVFCAPRMDTERWAAHLADALPEARVWAWSAQNAAEQADYAVVHAPGAAFFEAQHHLKGVLNMGAGVDSLLALDTLPRDVPLLRLEDAGKALQMAEYVSHALIDHVRHFDTYDAQQRAGIWREHRFDARADVPVGVMGLGAIGAAVARAIAGFGYPTFGWSRTRRDLPGITCHAGAAEFDAFLRATRVLVCVLPLTPETTGIVNAATLARLRPNAYLINIGRSGHVVDADLLAQIESGHVAGATLDVFAAEPLPPAHPFWAHPKIRITPHIAANTLPQDSIPQIVAKLRALARGDTLAGAVDFARGY